MKKFNTQKACAVIVLLATLLSLIPVVGLSSFAEEETTIITASDFQPREGAAVGIGQVKNILSAMKKDGVDKADGFFFCGDYDYSTYGVANETKEGISYLKKALNGLVNEEMVFVQGNHDAVAGTAGQNPSGNNDPKNGKYGVFVINQDDYMWYNSDETRIKKTAQKLIDYLNEKLAIGYDKPIFVLSHLPLHYSMRTKLEGDAKHAGYIFDVLNEGGKKGLNIIYLFGHDHANGWDDYLGGAAVYLAKGDSIRIAYKNQNMQKKHELNFTYMNAGYTGYYDSHNGGDGALTMCAVSISSDGGVKITRYDKYGVHDLKSKGVTNKYKGETGYLPDTTVYPSPQTIAPTSVNDKSPIADIMELNEGGRCYKRINNIKELIDGGRYLIVYNDSVDSILLPKVVEKSNAAGTRVGFELEKTIGFGELICYGEHQAKEWTLSKKGNGWLISHNGKFVKLTKTDNKAITATLEDEGSSFTISGEASYTFASGSYVFNYNARGLMNAYTGYPASFYIYEYAGHSLTVDHGSSTIDGNEASFAMQGDTVTVMADDAPEGMVFYKWNVVEGDCVISYPNSQCTTFIMGNEGVILEALYVEKSANTPQDSLTGEPTDVPANPGETGETTAQPSPKPNSQANVVIIVIIGITVVMGVGIGVTVYIVRKKDDFKSNQTK